MDNRRIGTLGSGSTWISVRRNSRNERGDDAGGREQARDDTNERIIHAYSTQRPRGDLLRTTVYDDGAGRVHTISFEGTSGSESEDNDDEGIDTYHDGVIDDIEIFEGEDDDDDADSDDDSHDDDDDGDMVDIQEEEEEEEGVDVDANADIGGGDSSEFSGSEEHADDSDGDSHDDEYISASHIVLSHENLPALVNSAIRRAHESSAKGSGRDRTARQQFMPTYLEKTAYGAMHKHLAEKGGKAGNGAGAKHSGACGQRASEPEAAQVAPDLFFRTLVQDTWPHSSGAEPGVPAIAGLRLGYGLGLDGRLGADAGQQGADGGRALGQLQSGALGFAARRVEGRNRAEQPRPVGGSRLPTAWQPQKNMLNMAVDGDRVSLRYTGPGRQDQDAAMVRSNYSIPVHTGVYYYEVMIKSRGQSGYIGVGLSQGGVGVHRLPGWDSGSWGYHGDDGNCFNGDGRGTRFGPGFTTGDTVGCGIDFMLRRIFFARNGVFIGYAFERIDTARDLFPCVGMRTPGEHVRANFGRRPFAFDIGHYVSSAHEAAMRLVGGASIQGLLPSREGACESRSSGDGDPRSENGRDLSAAALLRLRDSELGAGVPRGARMDSAGATLGVVLSHLLHNEYFATARALISNVVGPEGHSARVAAICGALEAQDARRETRRRICRHIEQGDIDYALGLLQDAHPAVLANESLVFQLRCRQFIELVRAANGCRIADCVPSDDDVMDVDDSVTPSMMSLAAITNAPPAADRARFGQIASLRKMEPPQLVRVLLDYGRQLQADYGASPNPIIREGLVHAFSLLAYADPAQSPVAALLDPAACKPLARLVDMAVRAIENPPRMSPLESICRHAAALLAELSQRRNGAASLLSMPRDFLCTAPSTL
ncbi:hypothetical protein H4R26_002672 [Coemansia thaxteri]|uniref:Ran-binding protein 10 n=1 Tax=Coemansia thaxteri TaxID=2663907 RepID=A0A9W8BKJ3_9FUNG|nr:hypothetical protein H4R26_002672 [Coemansia thaxteri]